MNNKYFILYPLIVLSYNVYFKAMIGLDNRFLPKELCQKNVRDIMILMKLIIIQESVPC